MSDYYNGEITHAYLESMDDDELVICIDVRLEDGNNVMTRARTGGNYPDIAKNLCEHLGIDWPHGMKQIGTVAGKQVQVRHKRVEKNDKVYDNYYIVTRKPPEPADDDAIKRGLAKLSDDSVPF